MTRASKIKRNLVTGTLLMASALTGYGRRAFAGCYSTGAPNYLCSGANYTPLSISANNATVTTDNTFSVNTSSGDALSITGSGNLVSFTDANYSSITATSGTGLKISTTGDIGGTGGVYVNASSPILAYAAGVDARNYGSGALSVTTSGNVTATGTNSLYAPVGRGIYALNQGTDLTINTSGPVNAYLGIFAINNGAGSLNIDSTGDVYGGEGGVLGFNRGGTDLSITTQGAVTTNGGDGVYGVNYGAGAVSITTTGDVVTGQGFGVYGKNYSGTDITLNVGYVQGNLAVAMRNRGSGFTSLTATGTLNGNGSEAVRASSYYGTGISINVQDAFGSIEGRNYGGGSVTVNAGNVESTSFPGIWVYNRSFYSTDVTITADSITVTNAEGVKASNDGTGALSVSITGDIHAAGTGIWTYGYGTDLTIHAHNIYSEFLGIEAVNHGSGATTITTGNVVGSGYGIRARNYGTDLTISTADASGYLGGVFAFNHGSGVLSITSTGNVTAYGEGAASYRQIDGIYARNYGTNLTIATAEVSGALTGIDAVNQGTGSLSITATGDVTGTHSNGISAINYGTDLTISAAGATGSTRGIFAVNKGTGSLSVTATGDVSATHVFTVGQHYYIPSNGIFARNYGTDLTINAASVSSFYNAIFAQNDGIGALSITATGDVTSTHGDAIFAIGKGTDITINAGTVNGYGIGIYARNSGVGKISVTVGDVLSGSWGIYAKNENSSATDLSISAGSVNSGGAGIFAQNYGTGGLTIVASGDVTASGVAAIYAGNAGTDLSINTHDINGYNNGILAINRGVGALTITASGDITGQRTFGVYAKNLAAGTDLSISAGAVNGYTGGVYARNDGTGYLSISTGAVSGYSQGIYAFNKGTGSLSISASGDVKTSGSIAIVAENYGQNLYVSTSGQVISGAGGMGMQLVNLGIGTLTVSATSETIADNTGIWAQNFGTDLSILTSAIYSHVAGIRAGNYGSGALTIASTGDVNGGIYGINNGVNLSIDVKNVVSGSYGIQARNNGGTLSITADDVTARYLNTAIGAYNSGTDLTINAGAINAYYTGAGIRAFSQGTGALSITLTGDIQAANSLEGIDAVGYGTNLSINTRNVHAYGYGIYAQNNGVGALSIATGNVTADTGSGIIADNHGTDLTINAGSVDGGPFIGGGIVARNYGAGALSITATGNVTGMGTHSYAMGDGIGIYARNDGTDLTINAAGISGYFTGIYARNNGSGALSITATGPVSSASGYSYQHGSGVGIYARNNGTDLNINAASASGYVAGIFARNYGTGALHISATGDVSGSFFGGILAINNGTDLSITTSGIVDGGSGGGDGIYAINNGSGALTIASIGDIIGGQNYGVSARNYGTHTNITVGNVTSWIGISARSYGTGPLSITATGNIDSLGAEAIRAYSNNGLSIAVHDVIGTIEASNGETGAMTISSGNVDAELFFDAIRAYNSSTDGSGLTITANSVTSRGQNGIGAGNESGILSISVSGDVNAENAGIFAFNHGTDLTIHAHDINAVEGIDATNYGSGVLSVMTGDIEANGFGIKASNSGTDMTIAAGAVQGYVRGLFLANHGSGALSITTTGPVTAFGNPTYFGYSIDGVYARNFGTNMAITVGGAGGTYRGIDAINSGTGGLSITTTGDVTGTIGDAMYARNNGSGPLNINIPSGVSAHGGAAGIDIGGNAGFGSSGIMTAGNITGDNGTAISLNNLSANTPITVNGGSINGDVIDSHPAGGFSPVTFTQNFTTNGSFDVSGIEINAGKTLIVGSGNTLAANTFTFDILNRTTFGKIAMTDTAFALRNPIAANDGQIFVNVTGTDNLNGHKFQIVDGDGTHAVVNGPGNTLIAAADNSALWDFDVVDGTHFDENASDLFLKARRDHTNNGSIANTNSLNTLLSLGDTSNPELLEAMGNINTAPTDGALDNVLASTLPDISGSDYAASQGADDTMNALEETRLASLRAGDDGESGMAAGNMAKGFGVWGQVFGQHADQGERDAVAGYTANTWGGAVGVDTTNVADRAVIGLAFSYGRTNASSDNANTTDTDIDSYQLSIYADYDLAKNTYLSGMAGFTWGNVDTERHNVTGVPGLTAHGNYNTQQFAAQVEAGHDFAVSNGMTLTPNILAHWTNWNPDSYTETGAGGANMHVEGDELDKFELGAGVKAAWSLKNHDGSRFKPELRASYRYDLEDDRIDDTAQFTGGGVAFSVPGPTQGRGTVDLGASLKLMTTNNWTFTASYDFDWKDQYTAHSGFVRAGYRF